MVVLAVVGTVLSFFHQGSLGGLYGVLEARPFAFRESVGIWPTTFFLFIVSAIATGPVFLALVTKTASAVSRKRLVTDNVYDLLGKISGWLLTVYVLLKSLDTLLWLNHTSPSVGVPGQVFYEQEPFGTWVLLTEIVVLGLVPAALLLFRRTRQKRGWFLLGAVLACAGVALNRFVMTMQTLSLPTLTFEPFAVYWPSWQETATFLAVVAYGVIVFSLSYRYLRLYPQERELNPAAQA
jgi:molybdopterin-containing oxidoreductase family membrane subunit